MSDSSDSEDQDYIDNDNDHHQEDDNESDSGFKDQDDESDATRLNQKSRITQKRALHDDDHSGVPNKRQTRGSVVAATIESMDRKSSASIAFTSKSINKEEIERTWKEMNETIVNSEPESKQDMVSSNQDTSSVTDQSDMVKVTRTYKFAGDIVTEEKWIPISQYNQEEQEKQEKQEKEQKIIEKKVSETNKPEFKGKLGGRPAPRKPSRLAEMAASVGLKPTKLNTLEKSKMDWNKYVQRQGIREELVHHNKDGYMEKQDFLNRTRARQEADLKASRKKTL